MMWGQNMGKVDNENKKLFEKVKKMNCSGNRRNMEIDGQSLLRRSMIHADVPGWKRGFFTTFSRTKPAYEDICEGFIKCGF